MQPSLHYVTDLATGIGTEPDPQDVADGVWSLLGTAFLGTLPTDVTCDDLVVTEQVLPPAIGVQAAHHVGAVGTGFTASNELPKAMVPLVNLHSGAVSRSARGHLFLCSSGKSSTLTAGTWTSAAQTIYNTFAALLDNSFTIGTIGATDVHPCVYSRTRHQRGTDPHNFQVVAATLKIQPTWLRSRLSSP